MPVHKIQLAVTVLVQAPTLIAAREEVGALSLAQIAAEMDDGAYVGALREAAAETVPPERVRGELEAIGNDGSFFDLGVGSEA